MQRRGFLKFAGATSAAVAVGGSLLVSSDVRHLQSISTNAGNQPDVDTVREMTGTFRRLDNRHGGGHGHVRAAVQSYIESAAEPLLRNGRGRASVKRDLLGATAELYQLAGWIAYDTGHLAEGSSHLSDALRLCHEAENDALATEMLAAMSHHAAFFSQTNEFLDATKRLKRDEIHGATSAVNLALAARQTAKRSGLWALQSEAAAMEAHGLALQKNTKASMSALRDAERAFDRIRGQENPDWLSYFDAAYLAAKFAHTLRDLGLLRDAEEFARRSLEMNDGYERGRLFNTALLASIVSDQGRVEEACVIGSQAVRMSNTVRSVRTVCNLADLGQRLNRFQTVPSVKALFREMSEHGIPTPMDSV